MYKKKLILLLSLSIIIMVGCADKVDFNKGVSTEDKKLLSSHKDKLLYIYKDRLRITENGFYPNISSDMPIYSAHIDQYYFVKPVNYLDIKKIHLQDLRLKLLAITKKYPELKQTMKNYCTKQDEEYYISSKLNREEINVFLQDNIDKKKMKKLIEKAQRNKRDEYCFTYCLHHGGCGHEEIKSSVISIIVFK